MCVAWALAPRCTRRKARRLRRGRLTAATSVSRGQVPESGRGQSAMNQHASAGIRAVARATDMLSLCVAGQHANVIGHWTSASANPPARSIRLQPNADTGRDEATHAVGVTPGLHSALNCCCRRVYLSHCRGCGVSDPKSRVCHAAPAALVHPGQLPLLPAPPCCSRPYAVWRSRPAMVAVRGKGAIRQQRRARVP